MGIVNRSNHPAQLSRLERIAFQLRHPSSSNGTRTPSEAYLLSSVLALGPNLMQTFSDTLGQVFRAILANKLRSFLTMFGIAWGVAPCWCWWASARAFARPAPPVGHLRNDVVMMWDGTIPALANQHTGMRPYQFTPGDEAALRALPEVRSVTAILNRNDLYEVSAFATPPDR